MPSPTARLVHVRLWAAARAAAGRPEATVTVTHAAEGGPSVEEVRRAVLESLPDRPDLPRVLSVCSALVGDRPVGAGDASSVVVPEGVDVEFLPPFAGG